MIDYRKVLEPLKKVPCIYRAKYSQGPFFFVTHLDIAKYLTLLERNFFLLGKVSKGKLSIIVTNSVNNDMVYLAENADNVVIEGVSITFKSYERATPEPYGWKKVFVMSYGPFTEGLTYKELTEEYGYDSPGGMTYKL